MEHGNRVSRRWRVVALLAMGALLGVALTATPAASHVGGTVNHLWGHLRPKADARYLPGGNLPRGKTIRGNFVIEDVATGASSHASSSISFGWRLASPPMGHVIRQGDTPPADCPGSLALPAALPGHLCFYEGPNANTGNFGFGDPVTNVGNAANRYGARLNLFSAGAGLFHTSGTWAVTAP